jgi:hypothetical protein
LPLSRDEREREGPGAKRWEGEGISEASFICSRPLTRRALRARHPLPLLAGEGKKKRAI